MLDLCLCSSSSCPRYKECYRGAGVDRNNRKYRSVNLCSQCNKNNEYSLFIKYRKEENLNVNDKN